MADKAGYNTSCAESTQASEADEALSCASSQNFLPLWRSRWPMMVAGLGLVSAVFIVPGAHAALGRLLRPKGTGGARISAEGVDAFVMKETEAENMDEELRELAPAPTPPPPCVWQHENCYYSKCCNIPSHTCYLEVKGYGQCMDSCSTEPSKKTGKSWSCELHGGYKPKNPVSSLPSVVAIPYPTLFCFAAVMPQSPEVQLMVAQKRGNIGIYACDNHTVVRAAASASTSTVLKDVALVAKYFGDIWSEVLQDKRYLKYDWTVKVEPDVVFLPERLKARIQKTRPAGDLIYYKNTFTNLSYGYLSSLMVFSKGAMSIYLEKWDVCAREILHFGESEHMMLCMDAIDVRYFQDVEMLKDFYTGNGSVEAPVDRCADERYVAFHPYLREDTWLGCYKAAAGESKEEAEPGDETIALEE